MRPPLQLNRRSAEEDLEVACRALDSAKGRRQAGCVAGQPWKLCSFVNTCEQRVARAAFSGVKEDDEGALCTLRSARAPDWSPHQKTAQLPYCTVVAPVGCSSSLLARVPWRSSVRTPLQICRVPERHNHVRAARFSIAFCVYLYSP